MVITWDYNGQLSLVERSGTTAQAHENPSLSPKSRSHLLTQVNTHWGKREEKVQRRQLTFKFFLRIGSIQLQRVSCELWVSERYQPPGTVTLWK